MGISLTDFKSESRLWYWQRDRHIDKWNKIENPKIDPHKFNKLNFDRGAKVIQ